jgi:hypothetical protein
MQENAKSKLENGRELKSFPALCAQAALTELAESGCDDSYWPGSPDIAQ